jgi:hypothetical protein
VFAHDTPRNSGISRSLAAVERALFDPWIDYFIDQLVRFQIESLRTSNVCSVRRHLHDQIARIQAEGPQPSDGRVHGFLFAYVTATGIDLRRVGVSGGSVRGAVKRHHPHTGGPLRAAGERTRGIELVDNATEAPLSEMSSKCISVTPVATKLGPFTTMPAPATTAVRKSA